MTRKVYTPTYETRKAIVAVLRKTPGVNGRTIAKSLGHDDASAIMTSIVTLRKDGVIRREGLGTSARWFPIVGREPQPKQTGRSAASFDVKQLRTYGGRTLHAVCGYHAQGNKRNGYCPRCIEAADPVIRITAKQSHNILKSHFPMIFSEGAE